MMQTVFFKDLGRIDYKSAWDIQEELVKQNVAIKAEIRERNKVFAESNDYPDVNKLATTHHLLFCEHPPVYT